MSTQHQTKESQLMIFQAILTNKQFDIVIMAEHGLGVEKNLYASDTNTIKD